MATIGLKRVRWYLLQPSPAARPARGVYLGIYIIQGQIVGARLPGALHRCHSELRTGLAKCCQGRLKRRSGGRRKNGNGFAVGGDDQVLLADRTNNRSKRDDCEVRLIEGALVGSGQRGAMSRLRMWRWALETERPRTTADTHVAAATTARTPGRGTVGLQDSQAVHHRPAGRGSAPHRQWQGSEARTAGDDRSASRGA